ncbi:hypothetical protein ACFQGA_17610 [Marinobacter koreensis]|uniref:MSHA biogenesis protein MshP n=1 Tax=Marinobacter koreensis TaxID=335974 RepID=A0ABW0RNH2_9GAMM|nr:hypothetical protein [Marinobacter koreensis]MCK7549758.1 hypothetical protein [Marinobacter koreensis]
MYPRSPGKYQNGAGLPIAIFVITVLSLLVFGMAQLQQQSGESLSLQIQSQRAFFAAESGAQVGVTDVLYEGRVCPASGSSWTIAFTKQALSGCEARLQCSQEDATAVNGNGGDRLYTILSEGRCGMGQEAARRVVEVRVR